MTVEELTDECEGKDVLAAISHAADRLARSPEVLAVLSGPALRDVTIGELLEADRARCANELRGRLSDRELQVVRLIVEGLSNKEISVRLSLSDKTVKNHISHILAKLNLTARTQVAVLALRGGIF